MRTRLHSSSKTYTLLGVLLSILWVVAVCAESSARPTDVSAIAEESSPVDTHSSSVPQEKKKKSRSQSADVDMMLEIKDIKDQAEIFNQKAILLFEAGRYEEAQQMWQKAITFVEEPQADLSVDEFVQTPIIDEKKEVVVEESVIPESSAADTEQKSEPIFSPAPAQNQDPHRAAQGVAAADNGSAEDLGPGGSTEQDKQRQEAVAEIYKDAINLYRNGDFDRAKERFEEVQWLVPGYRASDKYIKQIESELEYEAQIQPVQVQEKTVKDEDRWEDVIAQTELRRREELEEKAEKFYQQAIEYLHEQKLLDAQEKFEEIEVFYPGYRDMQKYFAQIEQQLQEEQEVIRHEESLLERRLLQKEESEFERVVRERELERMKGIQEKADALYGKAVELYKGGQYQNAKIRFEEVEVLFPDYKFTRKYLSRVAQDIVREEKERLEQKQRQESLMGKKEMKEWRRAVEESEQSHQRKLNEEAERIYQQARRYYAKGDARKAKLYFQEVGRTVPHYKSTDKFLARVNQDLVKERRQRLDRRYRWKVFVQKRDEERLKELQTVQQEKNMEALRQDAEPLYLEAKELYQKGEYVAARQKFMEVVQKVPDYKSSTRFLERLDEDIRRQQQYRAKETKRARERKKRMRQFLKDRRQEKSNWIRQRRKEGLEETLAHIKGVRQEKSNQKAQALYEDGQAYYKDRLLEVAQSKFLEIERIIPDYKSTRKYLARIQSEIEGKEQSWPEEYRAKRRALQDAPKEGKKAAPSMEGTGIPLTSAQQDFFQTMKNERLAQQKQMEEGARKELVSVSDETVLEPIQLPDEEKQEDSVRGGGKSTREDEHLKEEPASKEEPIGGTDQQQKPMSGESPEKEESVHEKGKNVDIQMKRAVEKTYTEALRYCNKKKFHSAELKIKEAESYLGAGVFEESFVEAQRAKLQKLRERVQSADARQLKEKDVAAFEEKKSVPTAVKKLPPVKVQDPSSDETLRSIEDQQAHVRRERERARESFEKKLDQIYKEAVRNYKKEKFSEARALFLEIEEASPDYKKARDYLEKINGKVTPGTAPQKKIPSRDVAPEVPTKLKADAVSEALDQWEAGR